MEQKKQPSMIDPRTIAAKLCSKSDFYNFLKYQGGFLLPSFKRVNTRFLKDVIAGRKKLVKQADIRQFNVPKFQELSVQNLFDHVSQDKLLIEHLNYYDDEGKLPERLFFFQVLGTIHPDYLQELIKKSNRLRNQVENQPGNQDLIEIDPELFQKIQSEPYFSKTKGKTLNLLKVGSKPRKQSKKRQMYEISKLADYSKSDEERKEVDIIGGKEVITTNLKGSKKRLDEKMQE